MSGTESMDSDKPTLRVTQVRSLNRRRRSHQACVRGLGLRRIGHTVEVEDTPAVRGMIAKAHYLVRVESDAASAEGGGNV